MLLVRPPSLPLNGDVFTETRTPMVGGSMGVHSTEGTFSFTMTVSVQRGRIFLLGHSFVLGWHRTNAWETDCNYVFDGVGDHRGERVVANHATGSACVVVWLFL